MKWRHIMDEQPAHGESIIQVDAPYKGHYSMGMRDYFQTCSFEHLLEFNKKYNINSPDFWWMPAKEFPFPDKKHSD